ncbi:hypothetical protein I316_03763 [Kwoniella heveanensis BCC8398]|uniref:Phosphoglycerate mutase n=1 Tax=Kwoniella heveanensis BCC8398 TaxID=1296120 RepID=A0A1B9GUK0_9TREE|nr:hypothetical protein I316_03763 [Kwoniella heveanensis BCC8398]
MIQGQLDVPLNAFGRSQAETSAELFKDTIIDELWSSTLIRAKETAQIVGQYHLSLGHNAKEDDRLKERGMGSWEGCLDADVGQNPEPEDAEAYDAVVTRIIAWLRELLLAHQTAKEDRTILVVTHEDCITALGRYINTPESFPLAGIDLNIYFQTEEGVDVVDGCPNLGVSTIDFTFTGEGGEAKWVGFIKGWAEKGPV